MENGCAVVVAVGPGVPRGLLERSVVSAREGLDRLEVGGGARVDRARAAGAGRARAGEVLEGLVVVCWDGPSAFSSGVLEVDAGSSGVEVWRSSRGLGRYGVDKVVVEMLVRIAAWVANTNT